jgi:hypothetical protein
MPGGLRAATAGLNHAAQQYLGMLENFAGFAERHWNEKEESYDAKGSGVTWARGNGGVCLVNAILLTELPAKAILSPQQIPRATLLDHTRRAIRKLCLTSQVCTDPRAIKPGAWGGPDPRGRGWHWQAALETEHWVVAARLLGSQLDADTLALVHQVAGAEADAAVRKIPSARKGDTAADDCSWNAGLLGVCAAIYTDDPRAEKWDEWAKCWALNIEARETDRQSSRMIDEKPLSEWLVSVNVFPDLTLENHGFWDLPYQTSFAALIEPIVAHRICGRKIPEAFHANALEEGEQILKWLVMPDGDLLCPQGIDWAERDVQHSWAFTELGAFLDQPWARAAERRCLELLTRRQAVFGDGSIHALDFGYETDLATVWGYSFLLHKFFAKADAGPAFDEPHGSKVFPYVAAAVHRSADLVSSVSWFRSRQAIMVSPNQLNTLKARPSFTRYDQESGTGWIRFEGEKKKRAFDVEGQPQIHREGTNGQLLTVSFSRSVRGRVRQQIGYCALDDEAVLVFSRWQALGEITVAELVDHPFRWVEIEKFISKPGVRQGSAGVWEIDDKLRMQILGAAAGELAKDGINGVVRRDFSAKSGDVLLETVCIYQPILPTRSPYQVAGNMASVRVGPWRISRDASGGVNAERNGSK